jgi:3-deoxy-7-phosphoheptulonate synthase
MPASAAADVLLVGAANMQNFSLLKEVGRSSSKPVVLVRGWHATLKEWLNSAEYVLLEGNPRVILCEAGIRSFESGSRVILDLSAVPAVKAISHLPILVDLDRAGEAAEIERMGLAAVAAGADGLIVDVVRPAEPSGPSEGTKGIALEGFDRLVRTFAAMRSVMEDLGIDRS